MTTKTRKPPATNGKSDANGNGHRYTNELLEEFSFAQERLATLRHEDDDVLRVARGVMCEASRMMAYRHLEERFIYPEEMDYFDRGSDRYGTSWDLLTNQGVNQIDVSSQRVDAERRRARRLYNTNTHYRGIIENLVNYIVGETGVLTLTNPNEDIQSNVRELWNEIKGSFGGVKYAERAKEFVRRRLRDGEVFLRRFPSTENSKGRKIVQWRFVEPEDVVDPEGTVPSRDLPQQTETGLKISRSYGIETLANDVETVLAYWVRISKDKVERVPASEMIHAKIGTDLNVKRGLPFLLVASRLVVRYNTWLEDRIILNKVRTAIALIRKRSGARPGTTGTAVQGLQTGTMTMRGGDGVPRTVPTQTIQAGTIIDAPDGVEYEYLSPNVQAQDVQADGRAILLAIACGVQLPEFLVSGDASNSNYSSTLVSEAPAVMAVRSHQTNNGEYLAEIGRQSVEEAAGGPDSPLMQDTTCIFTPPNIIVRDELAHTQAIQIRLQNNVIDLITAQEESGYDPQEIRKRQEEIDLNPPPGMPTLELPATLPDEEQARQKAAAAKKKKNVAAGKG